MSTNDLVNALGISSSTLGVASKHLSATNIPMWFQRLHTFPCLAIKRFMEQVKPRLVEIKHGFVHIVVGLFLVYSYASVRRCVY